MLIVTQQVLASSTTRERQHEDAGIIFENEDDKTTVISHSNLLRRYDQFDRVFISSDRTKFEREKHTKLVNELTDS